MKTFSGKVTSYIGIGTFGIGGRGHRDVTLTERLEDNVYIDALVYMLDKGINFTEISLGYGQGNTIRLFKNALNKSSVKREDVFITHSLYPRDLTTIDAIYKDISDFYSILETNYSDSTLVTQSLIIKYGKETIYPLLHELLKNDKTRYVSLSNASPDCILVFKREFGEKFYAHEGHLSFEIRALQDKGVFDLCDTLQVRNIIWRPLGRGSTLSRRWDLLEELSGKYGKTHSQIILNWLSHLGYYPMVFSTNKEHIDENLSSLNFNMSEKEYKLITEFRVPNYSPPAVRWDKLDTDDDIVGLIKNFNDHYS